MGFRTKVTSFINGYLGNSHKGVLYFLSFVFVEEMLCCVWRSGCILRLFQVGYVVGRVVLGQEFLVDFRLFSVAVIPSVRHNRI
jgi:hypothetical protein